MAAKDILPQDRLKELKEAYGMIDSGNQLYACALDVLSLMGMIREQQKIIDEMAHKLLASEVMLKGEPE